MNNGNDIEIKLSPVCVHFLLDILENQFHIANKDPTNAIKLYEEISEQIGDKVTVDKSTVPYFRKIESKEAKASSWRRFWDSF
jgi:hypothetical protein